MTALGLILVGLPGALFLYSYLGYPLLLKLGCVFRTAPAAPPDPHRWPAITILLPAYNEEHSIGFTVRRLLELDYPADRRHILVVSDCSTDHTDDIVRGFASQGVELLQMPTRGGKTAAENAAFHCCRGEILINLDATTSIPSTSLKPLVRAFGDPTVGVASGRDVSVGDERREENRGEARYVGYEMWVRDLETRLGSIVGASGCFYAKRLSLVRWDFPAALSKDFAGPLHARRLGFRSVSVPDAVCLVPRTRSLHEEFRRKVRTMSRGLSTLWHERELLNPVRYGLFAWMLFSHKLCRWLVFALVPAALAGLILLAFASPMAFALLAVAAVGIALGALAFAWPKRWRPIRPVLTCGFLAGATLAGVLAWFQALTGQPSPIWEPTRRVAVIRS